MGTITRFTMPFKAFLNRYFQITARGSTIGTECIAALTTFATMSYVLAVHPMIMADAGMDRAQVLTVTAAVACVFSILMGLMANLPIAQAPGMGSNGLVAYTIVLSMGVPWPAALGLVFWSGLFFLILTLTGVRRMLLDAFPDSLKSALTAGIGLFIMFIGLKAAGIVSAAPAPILIQIGDITEPAVLLTLIGIPVVITLMAKRVLGGMFMTIVLLTVLGIFIDGPNNSAITQLPSQIFSPPSGIDQLWFALDFGYLWTHFDSAFPVLLSLIFIDLFSSLAAMNAMCQRAGLVDANNTMLKPTQALSADALATMGAAIAGTSTTNCYGESAAGIESGGRTGLTAIIVGLLFLVALFFTPLILIIPAQATAPALVFIGLLMFTETRNIDFDDVILGGSATLTLILMAVTSISDGMALGLIAYTVCKVLSGKARQIPPLTYILCISFGLYYALAS